MKREHHYDVFISYSHEEADRKWVRDRLVPALEMNHLRVLIDYRHFRLGQPIINEIERAIDQGRYTLAVLSPSYLRSTFAQLESVLAEHLGVEEGRRRLIAILRQPCQPRLNIRSRLWLDMTRDDEFVTHLQRLVEEVRQPGLEL